METHLNAKPRNKVNNSSLLHFANLLQPPPKFILDP